MRVADVMTEGVEAVAPTVSVAQARALMRAKGIEHLAVLEGNELVGIVSARDLDGGERAKARGSGTVGDVMSRHVVTVTPATAVNRAANMLRGRSIGSLVVTDGRKVVGIVTVSDLLDLLGQGVVRPIAQGKRWTLKHRTPHVKKPRATGVW